MKAEGWGEGPFSVWHRVRIFEIEVKLEEKRD
jgi:hypothetical protein